MRNGGSRSDKTYNATHGNGNLSRKKEKPAMVGMITEKRAIQKGIESGSDFLQGRRCSGIRTPLSFLERLFPGRVEMKGAGKVFGERMVDRGFFCRRQERDDAHGHIRRAEFGKHLTAGATWMGRRIGGTAANHEREEMPFSFGDRLEDGSPFGAVGQAVRCVFDVDAGPDRAIVCQQGGTDGVVRVGDMAVGRGGASGLHQEGPGDCHGMEGEKEGGGRWGKFRLRNDCDRPGRPYRKRKALRAIGIKASASSRERA